MGIFQKKKQDSLIQLIEGLPLEKQFDEIERSYNLAVSYYNRRQVGKVDLHDITLDLLEVNDALLLIDESSITRVENKIQYEKLTNKTKRYREQVSELINEENHRKKKLLLAVTEAAGIIIGIPAATGTATEKIFGQSSMVVRIATVMAVGLCTCFVARKSLIRGWGAAKAVACKRKKSRNGDEKNHCFSTIMGNGSNIILIAEKQKEKRIYFSKSAKRHHKWKRKEFS